MLLVPQEDSRSLNFEYSTSFLYSLDDFDEVFLKSRRKLYRKHLRKKFQKNYFFPEMRAKIHSAHFIEMDCRYLCHSAGFVY